VNPKATQMNQKRKKKKINKMRRETHFSNSSLARDDDLIGANGWRDGGDNGGNWSATELDIGGGRESEEGFCT